MARLTTQSYVKIGLLIAIGVILIGGIVFGSYAGYRVNFGSNYSQSGGAEINANDIDTISVDWAAGSVDIVVHDGDKILLTEYANQNLSRSQEMRWEVSGKTLRIDYGTAFGCNSFGGKRLEIKVPKTLAEDMVKLDIDGASGEYTINGITCDEFKVALASGSLNASNMTAEDLRLEFSSGNAFVEGEISNKIKADVASGNIEVRCVKVCPKEIDADMASGSVTVSIPENDGFTVKVDKLSGNFESDFALQQNGSTYTYKNGDASFKADMASGRFILKKTD